MNGSRAGKLRNEDSTVRSVVAIVLPVLAGAFAYAGLALGATSNASLQSWMVLLPAMLVSVLVVALVFLPLWSFLAHRTKRIRRAFVGVSATLLAVGCSIFLATGAFSELSLMLVPGIVLITTFGMLMDPGRVRGGRRPIEPGR